MAEENKQAVDVIFSRKSTKVNHPPIFFNGTEVSKVNQHKHLGLTLDIKLSFVHYANESPYLLTTYVYLYSFCLFPFTVRKYLVT